ncbi:hypothetical protein WA026_009961 [Henosepilachna vigintioctopunctata]|uniref:CRAL-TRIO domain-containing protein n=1 Tax=Henosepilachna vigintioctopunctata TaxID=420089 RepID=A0AAW1TJB5_9CUCU
MSMLYECRLSEDTQKYAAHKLNETKDNRNYCLNEIKSWSEENPHLHIRSEPKYVLPFLRNCKFDLAKTKEKLKNFYTMRRDRIEWYENRDPYSEDIEEIMKLGCFLILKETYENHLVVIMRPTLQNPKIHTLDNMLKVCMMILDTAIIENELSQIYGLIVIVDLKYTSFAHVKQFSISTMRHLAQALQNYHCRPQKIEFVNTPFFVNVVLNLFKTFMPEKLSKRVHVNSTLNILDKAILPKEYEGEGESVEDIVNFWRQKVVSRASWFLEDEKHKADFV